MIKEVLGDPQVHVDVVRAVHLWEFGFGLVFFGLVVTITVCGVELVFLAVVECWMFV